MNFKDSIRSSLRISDFLAQGYLADITPDEMLHRPVPERKSHCLAVRPSHRVRTPFGRSRRARLHARAARWLRRTTSPRQRPIAITRPTIFSKEEYIELAKKVRAATLQVLDRFNDADFDKPVTARVPPFVKCAGDCFATIGPHWSLHAGQWVVIRRKLNRPVMF